MPTAAPFPPGPDNPIGVLDSGVGGLSVLRAIRAELPHESVLYVADQTHLPYGPRPPEEIRTFVTGITRFLLAQGAKIIVVACNAASAASLHYLRKAFPGVPFIGMEPAVKPASQATKSGVIGVLTTEATANGPLYARVVERYAKGVQVETLVCPELVQAIENKQTDLSALRPIFEKTLAPALAKGADQIVLGCTHFPFAAAAIRAYAGPDVQVIDPSPAIARQTRRVLAQHDLLNNGQTVQAPSRYYTTGDPARFLELIEVLLSESPPTTHLTWIDGRLEVPITQ